MFYKFKFTFKKICDPAPCEKATLKSDIFECGS